MKDLHALPKIRDSWSYLYVEHCRVDQEHLGIAIHDKEGKVAVPCATLSCLMLGPGTSVTHAAVKNLADCGCLLIWSGEEAVRFYAQGMGETRRSANVMHQAKVWADKKLHLETVVRLYRMRFPSETTKGFTLQQLRGLEGVRVREMYRKASEATGVPWRGRAYDRKDWHSSDPINRALSAANSCLYGVCHAAIVSAGFSPALGFIHTGKMTSFVYDIADLYKAHTSIPAAFKAVCAESSGGLEGRVRRTCRDLFQQTRMLKQIIPDIEFALGLRTDYDFSPDMDTEEWSPSSLWDPAQGPIEGGVNYSKEGDSASS